MKATTAISSAVVSNPSFMTEVRFADLKINPQIIKAITEVMKYQFLTKVQVASLPVVLAGNDVLCKAKTGTGKTMSFLIPSIEILLSTANAQSSSIYCLVLSPTRELASQIAAEAKQLLHFHSHMKVVTVTGGTNINGDKRALEGNVHFLVATPGRLLDLLANFSGFSNRFKSIRTLIFDEADQLLDMGFRPDIERILQYLPPSSQRHNLCFSATMPPAMIEIAKVAMKSTYKYVDTVGEDVDQTHLHVKQEMVVASLESFIPTLHTLLQCAMRDPEYKVIVFFSTANFCAFMSDLFKSLRLPVLEIHSRKSQSNRTKTSDIFRDGKRLVLFSSDVSARGMDYPGVSYVIQCGMTNKEQYIHRLGRTARAGREGSGMLLLFPFEEVAMKRELKELPVQQVGVEKYDPSLQMLAASQSSFGAVAAGLLRDADLAASAAHAYQAHMGFYNSNLRKVGWTKEVLVLESNELARVFGFVNGPPPVQAKTIGKMGLKGVPGLNITREQPAGKGPPRQAPQPQQGGGTNFNNNRGSANQALASVFNKFSR